MILELILLLSPIDVTIQENCRKELNGTETCESNPNNWSSQ